VSDRIIIFDTTLRDGEQAPGINLNAKAKLEIAEQLARLGVDVIEAGFPVASQGDFEAVRAIARTVEGPTVAGLARANVADVDRCFEAVRDAGRARIHVFLSTSPSHMEHMLRMSPEQVVEATRSAVARAREQCDDVEFSPQDATRTPMEFLLEVLHAAVEAGATTLNIPDTVGYAMPWGFAEMIRRIRAEVAGDYVLSSHCHNDLGLATANSLAAVGAGVRQIEVCVNGIGERAGNASLEEVVMGLRTRRDQFDGMASRVNTEEIVRTSRLVSRLTGYPVQYNKAVVGKNAFAHESGIHQHGVLSDRSTYEIIDAREVGGEAAQIVLGKHSGRHAVADALTKLGFELSKPDLDGAFARFKELADKKPRITEADLEAIVSDEVLSDEEAYTLIGLQVAGGTALSPTATVRVGHEGGVIEESAIGDGMVDAACAAIAKAVGVDAALAEFNVAAVTGGSDALGEVTVQVEAASGVAAGTRVTGRAVATDIVEASARAYLQAVNKLSRVRARVAEIAEGSGGLKGEAAAEAPDAADPSRALGPR
jgi:2-isopropylmalate synthase